jgi:hypothetical protein
VNQAALGQRTEMIRKTVPHSFRVSLSVPTALRL